MNRYYPIYLNIANRLCVVVGGGSVAERKAIGLLETGARVRVVSPEATQGLRELAGKEQIEYLAASYQPEHLSGATLVFAATNVREVNARVAADARALHITINVADAPDEGDFLVPSVVRRGEFCVGISTGGNNPTLAARLAAEMQTRFGPEYGEFVQLLGDIRDTIKEETTTPLAKRAAAAAILDHEAEVRAHLAAGRPNEARALALALARAAASGPEPLIQSSACPTDNQSKCVPAARNSD